MKALQTRKYLYGLIAGVALNACSAVTSPALGNVNILIDPTITYQTMNGWEVSGRMWQFDKKADQFNNEWESFAPEILDKLVNQLGVNRFRLEALSGIENPTDYWTPFVNGDIGYLEMREHFYEKLNDNNSPYETNKDGFNFGYIDYIVEKMLLPIKERVENNNEQLFINLTYVDFKWTELRGDIEHAAEPDEYAEFVLVVFDHLKRKYNLVPDSLELILEADNTHFWSGTNIGKALLSSKQLLNDNGYFPEFIATSTATAWRTKEYFDGLQSVAGAADALDELSYHRYDSAVSATTLTTIAGLAKTWNLRSSMLEHVGADYRELMDDILLANVSSWQQYGIATNLLDDPGGYYIKFDDNNGGEPKIYMDKRATAFSIAFPFIRRNAIRIDTQSEDQRLKAASFLNTNDSMVTLISTESANDVTIDGLSNGNYKIYHSNPNGELSVVQELIVANSESQGISARPGLTSIVSVNAGLDSFEETEFPDSLDTSEEQGLPDREVTSSSSGTLSIFMLMILLIFCFLTIYKRRIASCNQTYQ